MNLSDGVMRPIQVQGSNDHVSPPKITALETGRTCIIVGMIYDPETAITQAQGGHLDAASQVVRDYARLLRLQEAEPRLDMLTIGKEYFRGDVVGPQHSYYNVDISSYRRGWKRVTTLNHSPIAIIAYDWVRMPTGYDHFLHTHLEQLIHNHLQRATAPPYADEVQYIFPFSSTISQCVTAGYHLISQYCQIEVWRGEERMNHPLFAATINADLIYGDSLPDSGFIVIRHQHYATSTKNRALSLETLRQKGQHAMQRPHMLKKSGNRIQADSSIARDGDASCTVDSRDPIMGGMPTLTQLIKAWRSSEAAARGRCSGMGVYGY